MDVGYAKRISRNLGARLLGMGLNMVRRFLDEHAQKAKISCKCGETWHASPRAGDVSPVGQSCGEIAGKMITFRQVKALFEGKGVKAKRFKLKSGKKFSAVMYIEDEKVKSKFNTNTGPIRGDGKRLSSGLGKAYDSLACHTCFK